ncbi:hypothetical protein IAG41_08530 [Sphingomonas sp. JC676]|uniref:hypothetical protein n=1 Tax=Sphingomonas sp. JC676 TaxID=2768065 RepID=UPI0016577488|nr:hypothetical protein [Sphingomonas sp. JC676]MBC9032434.1 hypothetical protein [Sphingomonas sp. JC676]
MHIETRLIIAYALIALLAVAAVALAYFIRHNSHAQKTMRDRRRDQARREKRALEK